MKVLLGSSLYEPYLVGGAERVVHLLAQRLRSLGHDIAVITTQPTGPAGVATLEGVTVHYVPVRNLYRSFTGIDAGSLKKLLWRAVDSYNILMRRAIGRVLDAERPDVLNTHSVTGFSVLIWAEAKRRRIPIVHTLHDQYLLCHRGTMFKPPRNCVRRCIDCRVLTAPRKRLSRLVSCVVGVSEFILERHKSFGYFASQDSAVIYNTAFRRPPGISQRSAAPRVFRFGFLGQVIPTKGVRELIAAFRRAELGAAELWIGGRCDSPYASLLQAETRDDMRIRWLGYVDAEKILCEVDVLAVPSIWNDTAPLVIFEAFGYGLPVLGAARGGIPEFVTSDCGWIFDPDAPFSLDRALAECVSAADRLASMRTACVERARRASEQPWAQAYLTAFRQAIGPTAGALDTGYQRP